MRALRRDPMSADSFPQDVLELQGYLTGPTRIPGVEATPGKGTNVPLYILGSSLFGARLAAQLGLPYAFASHFAPDALQDAVAIYRRDFQPSAQLDAPARDRRRQRDRRGHRSRGAGDVPGHQARPRLAVLRQRPRRSRDDEADMILDSPQGQHVAQMMKYSAVGTPDAVLDYLDEFAEHADADELIVAHQSTGTEARLRSVRAAGRRRRAGPRLARRRLPRFTGDPGGCGCYIAATAGTPRGNRAGRILEVRPSGTVSCRHWGQPEGLRACPLRSTSPWPTLPS